MMTTHEMIRNMALRMNDETSHFSREELRRNAETDYRKANKAFHKLLEEVGSEPMADKLHEAAMNMVYAYGDLYAEKGIRFGMRFMAEQVMKPEPDEERPV